jgi:hypothetical protein
MKRESPEGAKTQSRKGPTEESDRKIRDKNIFSTCVSGNLPVRKLPVGDFPHFSVRLCVRAFFFRSRDDGRIIHRLSRFSQIKETAPLLHRAPGPSSFLNLENLRNLWKEDHLHALRKTLVKIRGY